MPRVKLNTSPDAYIGENIKKALAIRGLSQKQFALHMNKSAAQVNNWIKCNSHISMDDFLRAAEVLKIAPWDLIKPTKEFGENCLRFLA